MKCCRWVVAGCVFLGFLWIGGEPPRRAAADDVAAEMQSLVEADWFDQDRAFSPDKAAAEASKVAASKVTTAQDASGGCDGIKNGRWGFHVASGEKNPWWQVDLGKPTRLDRVVVFNRTDSTTAPRTAKIRVLLSQVAGNDANRFEPVYQHDGSTFFGINEKKPLVVDLSEKNVTARVVRLQIPGNCSFALDEIEVYGADDPKQNLALGKPADQISVGQHSHPGTLGASGVVGALQGGGFSLAHTRDVLDRAKRLAERIRPTRYDGAARPSTSKTPASSTASEGHRTGSTASEGHRTGFSTAMAELERLDRRLAKMEQAEDTPQSVRQAIYLDARRLLRKIAFCNPLLNIDKLLFIKRHDSGGVFHMCDQYYGCNAKPGGGLFVLENPFGDAPRLVNLLENSVVENGRLQGDNLSTGSFLSPEVSFDGRTILFAYSEAKAKQTYQWSPEFSQHIFKVNADGTGLVQLTDGSTDDFDPCFTPDGRIVFVSERRGGYLRCGRHCPVYTMFSMEPDGSDIICISYHETHEWHPSVNNEGMLVYSRWDYVDRDTNIAHHIWTCFTDGRDPRSFHGNYPVRREGRPWMEMSIRAIPGSHRYVATTGAHHGQAFGSLVLIDPRPEDDDAMSQLTRLTPDVPFPEAEGRPINKFMCYGTAWPLSEDDYLCVYDGQAKNRGVYWIDRHGNRELIYRDPSISCLSPIPLRPRPTPPIIPSATTQTATAREKAGGRIPQATISVMNVYDSDFPWPADAEVKSLRVIQLLPKSTAPPNQPRIGVADQTNARAVLGTAPVEADGSVRFEAPVGVPIYFQALDAQGMAIQSMRSATYVHPGENLTCQGCHERKHDPPSRPQSLPLAMRRPPSKLKPDVDGSNPFNYPRLVQPVLDRHCVSCHQQEKAIDLSGQVAGNFTQSYNNLAGKYGFYFHVSNGAINKGVHGGSRTIAGKFGARASELLKYMDERHHGVKLSPEEHHRLTLWLDCNSEFLGSYENVAAQLRGEVVRPTLE